MNLKRLYSSCERATDLWESNLRATVKAHITTGKFFIMSFPYAQNSYIITTANPNSTSKSLGTNVAFVKRVHCITIIISILIRISSRSILIIIIIKIIAKHVETALAFIFEVFIIYRLVISKFPDFSLTCA